MAVKSYKRGSKTLYSARFWYYKNGVKKSKYKSGFTRKKDAENWAIDTKRKLENLAEGSDNILVEEFLARWIKTKEKKLSPSTLQGYRININHINNHIGKIKLSKVRLLDVQEMLDKLSDGRRKKTISYIYRVLHAALEYAVKTDLLVKNPCKGVEIAEDKEQFEANIYTAADLRLLFERLREQEHVLYIPCLIAAMRGLRRGEILGLKWSDIDFKKECGYVRNNYIVVDGKGYHRRPKTKTSERVFEVSGFLAEELQEHKKRQSKVAIPTYVCEKDGELPEPSHIARQLRNFQKANNLPVCRFHDLRHTFAVRQLELGTDLDTLKRLLGHSKIGVTSDIYLKQNISLIKKATNKLDNVIFIEKKNCHNNVTIPNAEEK